MLLSWEKLWKKIRKIVKELGSFEKWHVCSTKRQKQTDRKRIYTNTSITPLTADDNVLVIM